MSGRDPMVVSNPAKSATAEFLSVRNATQVVDNVCLNTMWCRSDGKNRICDVLSDVCCECVACLLQHLGNLMSAFSI